MAVADNPPAACGLEGERPTLVPPRVYDLKFSHYETARMFGRAQKIILWFSIAEPGEHFDKPIPRYYNVTRLIGKPGKNGAFKVAFHSDFLREFVALFGMPSRLDRIPMSRFDNQFVKARVKTVTSSHHQQKIPEALWYSVIEEIKSLFS